MDTVNYLVNLRTTWFSFFMITCLFYNPTDSGAVQLTQQNIDMTLASNELVFINFYADWCRFSNLLMPIFDEAAEAVAKEISESGKVVMGKVDCDKESSVASRFHITKYPTLKVIRNGQPAKREYRGQRSVEAFTSFIKKQLEDPIKEFKELRELGELESNKRIIIAEKCVPLVREITFENAEELTEEGLPFLILFHDSNDKESIKRFNEIVQTDLISEKQSINFLTADGKKFAHPLHHLGKSEKDLPLIAIDSFRHMYLFPNYKDIEIPGKLKQFVQDLYSGKLHREFHYGPDQDEETEKNPTTPPESTFKKLAPSKNRYTLLSKDEL
ncbi:hypothetical protein NQ318_004436 [Aromia moschata]|uniref:Thioredoxin domain-containing protein n=1 Tax=Aromia moschata TaxID=1265417 RepID=A0AAV8XPH5_9CUCU|nr:hypothetical protein NQ318_004436 [Aromia moschata]